MRNLKNKAFTLIELLVVIAIIGILSALIIVGMSSATQKANFAKAQVFANSLRSSLLNDMISEWKLDNGSGTTATDSWTGGNTGTLTGFTSTAAGYGDANTSGWMSSSNCVYGTCLKFEGSVNYISLTNDYIFTNNNTLSFWAKINAQDFLGIVGGNLGNWSYLRFGYDVGQYNHDICGETNTNDDEIDLHFNSLINTGQWYHFAITEDGSNVWKLYLNGILQTDTSTTASGSLTIRRIGEARQGFDRFNGSLDDIRIYNAVVPTSKIQQDYYVGLAKLLAKGQIGENEYIDHIGTLIGNLAKTR